MSTAPGYGNAGSNVDAASQAGDGSSFGKPRLPTWSVGVVEDVVEEAEAALVRRLSSCKEVCK